MGLSLKNLFKSRYSLILSGVLVGLSPTIFLTLIDFKFNILTIVGSLMALVSGSLMACYNSWLEARWNNGKKVSKIRKWRLLFFGISLSSFAFAFIDVFRFMFFGNINGIQVYGAYPWLVIQGIPFSSVLLSFATGGFFTFLERLFDAKEKGDI